MNYEQILSMIVDAYANEPDLVFLARRGDVQDRKQIADMVCTLPARLPPLALLEVSKWGVADEMSACRELRPQAVHVFHLFPRHRETPKVNRMIQATTPPDTLLAVRGCIT
jgi:hypothetical protein